MGETTAIEWTNHTFNPWIGCTIDSAECDNCYAKALADAREWAEWGRGKTRHLTKTWGNPRKWNQEAELEGRRHRVFCSSLADVFDAEVPEEYRQTLWPLIRETPHLDWQLLTKRPNLIKQMLPPDLVNAPHIWLGTSVGMPATTGRIPKLLETPAVVHFRSIEPLLGPIPNLPLDGIEWVILGGESGQAVCSSPEELARRRLVYRSGRRWIPKPTREVWVREIRDQCDRAGVPLFFKQWGGPKPDSAGHVLDGREWRQFPNPLGIEVPELRGPTRWGMDTKPTRVGIAETEPVGDSAEREVSDMGTKRAVSEAARLLGRLGGQTTSPAKARAARKNAKLGGWPKGRPRKPKKGATT